MRFDHYKEEDIYNAHYVQGKNLMSWTIIQNNNNHCQNKSLQKENWEILYFVTHFLTVKLYTHISKLKLLFEILCIKDQNILVKMPSNKNWENKAQ